MHVGLIEGEWPLDPKARPGEWADWLTYNVSRIRPAANRLPECPLIFSACGRTVLRLWLWFVKGERGVKIHRALGLSQRPRKYAQNLARPRPPGPRHALRAYMPLLNLGRGEGVTDVYVLVSKTRPKTERVSEGQILPGSQRYNSHVETLVRRWCQTNRKATKLKKKVSKGAKAKE